MNIRNRIVVQHHNVCEKAAKGRGTNAMSSNMKRRWFGTNFWFYWFAWKGICNGEKDPNLFADYTDTAWFVHKKDQKSYKELGIVGSRLNRLAAYCLLVLLHYRLATALSVALRPVSWAYESVLCWGLTGL